MIELSNELSDNEKDELKNSGKLISTEHPKTQTCVYKMKSYLSKISEHLGDKIKELLIEITSETAIKSMKEIGILPK